MVIHFICRGNVFRSLIAEAYFKSLGYTRVQVLSSGTVAEADRKKNEINHQETLALLQKHGIETFVKSHRANQLKQSRLHGNDITIFMNQRVYDEAKQNFELPVKTIIWKVNDIGEPGRIANTGQERTLLRERVYQEITDNVDKLATAYL